MPLPHGSAAAAPPSSAAAVATSTAVVTLPDSWTGGLRSGGLCSSVVIVRGQFAEQRLPLRADLCDFEFLRLLDSRLPVPPPPVAVVDQLEERARHARHVLRRDEGPVAAGVDDLGGPARAVEAHNRQPLAHCLHDHHAESLVPRAQREQGRPRHELAEALGRAIRKTLLYTLCLSIRRRSRCSRLPSP